MLPYQSRVTGTLELRLAHRDPTSSMLGAIEEEGHHGERYPATNENDSGKQHQLAWDGPNTGTLHQLGQVRYRHWVDRDLTVIGERLNAQDSICNYGAAAARWRGQR